MIDSQRRQNINKSSRRILPYVCFLLFLECFSAPKALSETTSKLFVYNSFHDILFLGKPEETIVFDDFKKNLLKYPSDFKLIGLGFGHNAEELGNYFVTGTIRKPLFYWADPAPPHRMEASPAFHSSFMVLAVTNPTSVFKRVIENAPDFLTLLADQMEKLKYLDLAAIRIEGKFSEVQFAITETITTSGESVPVPIETVFRQKAGSRWEMAGIYTRSQNLQLQVSYPGYPIHIHGFEKKRMRGGHIISASVERANVYIYPLREFDLYQNDLTIKSIRAAGKIKVIISNVGKMTVGQVLVNLEAIDNSVILHNTIPSMRPGQVIEVEFKETPQTKGRPVRVRVDPENRINELREDNNTKIIPPM